MAQSARVLSTFGAIEAIDYINLSGSRIINLASPVDATDAVNKEYVDASVSGYEVFAGYGLTDNLQVFSVNDNLPTLSGVGTIQTGTWSANVITVPYGGTGQVSFTNSQFILGNGSGGLQSYSGITATANNVNVNVPMIVSNTTGALNTTTAALSVQGGLSVLQNIIVGGSLSCASATINNLSIPGITQFQTLAAAVGGIGNLTVSNLFVQGSTSLSNLQLLSLTSGSLNAGTLVSTFTSLTNATLGSTLIVGNVNTLNSTTTSVANLNFNLATGGSLKVTNFTASNSSLVNCTVSTSVINGSTAGGLFITNATVANSYTVNGNTLNGLINNGTVNNLFSTSLTVGGSLTVTPGGLNYNNLSLANGTINSLNSNLATIGALCVNSGVFSTSTVSNLVVPGLASLTQAAVSILNAVSGTVSNLYTNVLAAPVISTGTLSIGGALFVSDINVSNVTVNNLIGSSGVFTGLSVNLSTVGSGLIGSLTAGSVWINSLASNAAVFSSANVNIFSASLSNLSAFLATTGTVLNLNVTSANVYVTNTTFATVGNLTVNTGCLLKKGVSLGANFTSQPLNSSGALLTTNPYYFTDSVTAINGTNPKWFNCYLSPPTLAAVNSNVTTMKAANLYIAGKPIAGPNQTIDYSTGLALGYIAAPLTGGSLIGQVMFERFDSNWFGSIYTDAQDKLILANASADASAGLGLYVYGNNNITLASVPNVNNITPTPFINFNPQTSQFLSSVNATNYTTASVTLAGGLAALGTVMAPAASIGNLNATGITVGNLNANTVVTGAGQLGPTFTLQFNYVVAEVLANVSNLTAGNSVLFREPGNPGSYGVSNLHTPSNCSPDTWTFNKARLIMRGVAVNTGTVGSTVSLQPYLYSNGGLTLIESSVPYNVTDSGSINGYTTWVSDWFENNESTASSLGVFVTGLTTGNAGVMSGGNVVIGPVYIQYSA